MTEDHGRDDKGATKKSDRGDPFSEPSERRYGAKHRFECVDDRRERSRDDLLRSGLQEGRQCHGDQAEVEQRQPRSGWRVAERTP